MTIDEQRYKPALCVECGQEATHWTEWTLGQRGSKFQILSASTAYCGRHWRRSLRRHPRWRLTGSGPCVTNPGLFRVPVDGRAHDFGPA